MKEENMMLRLKEYWRFVECLMKHST